MYLLELPVEIGALILSYLDKVSMIKAYRVPELRHFYSYVPNFMRKFEVSGSTLASVRTLHLDVFRDFAVNIHELNLSRIMDLTASQLSPHIQRCVNLKTLDVTFTSIYLSDLDDICPETLKNISVNFFQWPYNERRDEWKKSIDFFQRQRFECVQFIVFESFSTHSPLLFMNDVPKTKSLKITVTEYNYVQQEYVLPEVERNIDVNCETLNYVYRDCSVEDDLSAITNLNYNLIEYIFILHSPRCLRTTQIYVSPIFSSLFAVSLNIGVHTNLPSDVSWDGDVCIWFKAWRKSHTEFNDAFLKTLLSELTDLLPTYVCMHDKINTKLTQAPSTWYCIDSCQGFERIVDKLPEKVTLTAFCRKAGGWIQTTRPVHLTPHSNTLDNITFLRLSNICLTRDFFTTLFNQCKNLHTLDIEMEEPSEFEECSLFLGYSIHLTKSLKNFRATGQSIKHEMLFSSLCRCLSLENIHIHDYDRVTDDVESIQNVVLLIEKCLDLYSLFIETQMCHKKLKLLESSVRESARKLERDYLRITVRPFLTGWNPFAGVFDPSPLHILD